MVHYNRKTLTVIESRKKFLRSVQQRLPSLSNKDTHFYKHLYSLTNREKQFFDAYFSKENEKNTDIAAQLDSGAVCKL